MAVAALLVSLAITIAQLPTQPPLVLASIPDPLQWVRSVNDTVENIIVKDDTLSCSLEGIETFMLYIRL
jgi:hypothetical protein